MPDRLVRLFLCGDVMLGRGVDQILPHPGDPALREEYVTDARTYVEPAEAVNGPVPAPVPPSWPWGEALAVLDGAAPDVRIVNLETAITRDGAFAPGKAVHYRMHPANLPALTVARPDVCVLANNHVLDFGRRGLADTLDALTGAGLRTVGAGPDAERAYAPVALPLPGGGRLLVFALGAACSGVPSDWAASDGRSGVAHVPRLSPGEAAAAVRRVQVVRRPGDLVVVSVHWGSNWGYRVPREQIRFAHALVDGGADVVHGHSSHHPRPIEVYRDRLVLHGCGDFIDDYEGIGGYEEYRDDLRLAHLVDLDAATGRLTGLRMVRCGRGGCGWRRRRPGTGRGLARPWTGSARVCTSCPSPGARCGWRGPPGACRIRHDCGGSPGVLRGACPASNSRAARSPITPPSRAATRWRGRTSPLP